MYNMTNKTLNIKNQHKIWCSFDHFKCLFLKPTGNGLAHDSVGEGFLFLLCSSTRKHNSPSSWGKFYVDGACFWISLSTQPEAERRQLLLRWFCCQHKQTSIRHQFSYSGDPIYKKHHSHREIWTFAHSGSNLPPHIRQNTGTHFNRKFFTKNLFLVWFGVPFKYFYKSNLDLNLLFLEPFVVQ